MNKMVIVKIVDKKNMKRLICVVTILLFCFSGCKEDEIDVQPLATVLVVNAIIDGKVARVNTNLRDSSLNMDYKHFTILAGIASPIRVFPSSLPNIPYFNESLNTHAGDIYSLFLSGTHTSPESILIKENIPPYPTEEVINVRLVNMSPGSLPLNLTTGNAPTANIFSGISYKQASEFKTLPFPVNLPSNGNVFQIRDNSGNLLLSYTMPASGTVSQISSRKRNISIVVKGIAGGTGSNALGIILVPYY